MPVATIFAHTPDITSEDYCVFGLATCFVKEDGEVRQVKIIEPIPSAALETLFKGIPTSYEKVIALTVGDIFPDENPLIPPQFSTDATFCKELPERVIATVRTYKTHPKAKTLLPVGTVKEDFHYSVDRKRVLNAGKTVRPEDNVKQHSHTHKIL